MQTHEIPVLSIDSHMDGLTRKLRKNAPLYIASILENTHALSGISSLSSLSPGSIKVLTGGTSSAVYALDTKDKQVVIKLRFRGVNAEVEALKLWAKRGIHVTHVEAYGVVPCTKKRKNKVKFLILESVRDKQGTVAQTCFSFMVDHPESAVTVGKLFGKILAQMHKAHTTRTYGEFSDMWGKNNAPIKSWNAYLLSYLTKYRKYLLKKGLTHSKIQRVIKKIESIRFPKRRVFLHGDFTLHNAMIVTKKPLKIKIIDPNPLVGDSSWDIAVAYNEEEFIRRKKEYLSRKKIVSEYINVKNYTKSFLQSYEEATKRKLAEDHIRASQLMQLILLLQREEKIATKAGEKLHEAIDVMIRKDSLFEKMEFLAR